MSTKTTRLIRDGEMGGGGGGGGGGGHGGGGRERLYTYCYAVTTRMTPALRWAAMSHFNVSLNCEGQSHKTVSTNHSFWRERRAEVDLNQGPSAYQPNALLLGQTGSPLPLGNFKPFLFFLQFLLINTIVCASVRKVWVCVCMHTCVCTWDRLCLFLFLLHFYCFVF